MRPLDRLRLQLTAWYVGTFAAILAVLCGALFVAVSHSIGVKLDRSLARATSEVARSVLTNRRSPQPGVSGELTVVGDLRIPDRMLYLFNAQALPLQPETASVWVRSAVRTAVRDGSTSLEADIGHEHTLRVHATRFILPDGDTLVAAAAADTEELEDEFWHLITVFAVSLVGALGVVAVGGYLLARKSTAPVERSFEHMRRFMADAAHELRTPVSFLRAHTEVALQQSRTTAEYAEALREIGSE